MTHCQIVLDTNVLLAGLRSRRGQAYRLLQQLNDGRWQVNISTALLLEYEAVLKREAPALGLTLVEIDDVLDGLCAIARPNNIFYRWRPTTPDPADDFIIDLVVAAQADFLITYNLRHLQIAQVFGVQVVTPAEFFQQVGAGQ